MSDRAHLVPIGNEATVSLICSQRIQNSSRYTGQDLNTLLITFGDCIIESEPGCYECVILCLLLYLNNKDRHVCYN